jgi:transketolase
VLFDDNGISIDGRPRLPIPRHAGALRSHGLGASRVDGHDAKRIAAALEDAQTPTGPVLIACKTTIGFGAPKRAGTAKAHGEALGAEEVAGARVALDGRIAPFEIPADLMSPGARMANAGQKHRAAREGQACLLGCRLR